MSFERLRAFGVECRLVGTIGARATWNVKQGLNTACLYSARPPKKEDSQLIAVTPSTFNLIMLPHCCVR